MASANYEKAQELWHSFYRDVMYHQRYFISHPILDRLKEIAEKCELTLSPGSVYYRARIIDDKAASNEHMVAKCFGENSTEETELLRISNIAVDIDMNPEIEKSLDEWLLCFIQSAFSSPTNNPDDYIPTQIIAEYFRHLGYDGIRYSSSLHRGGYNLTIFDTSKCEAIFSTDLRLENIKIGLRPAIGAENIDGRFEYIIDNIPMKLDHKSGKLVEVQV